MIQADAMIQADSQDPNFEELAIPASEIIDALDTRPSRLCRHASVAYSRSAFHSRRKDHRFSSLQYAKGGTLRRPDTEGSGHDMAVEITPHSRKRRTVRLKERIRQEQIIKTKAVNQSLWEDFRHVKWPKLKSKLQVTLSYELWKVHMKQVEGNFGTAVVSYFILLRWLFLVNVGIFTLWFGFVCIPQFIWETTPAVTIKPNYQTTCVFNSSASYNCSNGRPLIQVYSNQQDNCIPPKNQSYSVRICRIDKRIAIGESSDIVTVWPTQYCGKMQAWAACNTSIAPYIPWYQYAIDFITGHGTFNETVLFLGHYTNATTIRNRSYRLPLVTLVMTGVVYAISFLLLVHKMGEAYNESYTEFGSSKKVNYCNKLFSLWDYNITDPKVVKIKKANNRTDLQEELASDLNRHIKRTWTQLAKVIVIRICTNLLVVIVLTGGGTAIYEAAQWSLNLPVQEDAVKQTLYGLVVPVVISSLNIILPFLFVFLAQIEQFRTRSGEIKMTLLRAIFVRVSSLVVLIITDYTLIKCTQPGGTGGQGADKCTLSGLDILGGGSNSTGTASNCKVECWETLIGQDFYKLAWTNCVVTVISTITTETATAISHKLLYTRIKWRYIQSLFRKGTFNIPHSILDLIYTQLLLWLGFLFSPLQPVIILLTFILTFYVKKYSLMWNLEPERRGIFKAARTNLLFLMLLQIALFGAIVFVGFAVARFLPSPSCSPFSFTQSIPFFCFIIAILLIVIYALIVIIRARDKRFELIKNQLILEGEDVAHVVGKMSSAMEKLKAQRIQALTAAPRNSQPALKKVSSPQFASPGQQRAHHGREQYSELFVNTEANTSL
ncbi:hypothetical protein EMCRGX_G027466 [Ephydatia muelleri]